MIIMSVTYINLDSKDPSVLAHRTASDFTVQLGQAHHFNERSEVFLSEMVLPFTWYNITSDNNTLLIVLDSTGSKTISLSPAYYKSIPVLVTAINNALKKASLLSVKITTDIQTRLVSIDTGASTIQGPLLGLLGWKKDASLSGKVTAPSQGDITAGLNSLYIMIDCIENWTQGSFSVPLLKKIEIGRHDRPGDLIHYRAQLPLEVHKLNQTTLMHIDVTIKDRINQVVDFNGFSVNLTLGIRTY